MADRSCQQTISASRLTRGNVIMCASITIRSNATRSKSRALTYGVVDTDFATTCSVLDASEPLAETSAMTCCVLDACEQTRHGARVPPSSTRCGDRAYVERVGERGAGRHAFCLKFLQHGSERLSTFVRLCLQG